MEAFSPPLSLRSSQVDVLIQPTAELYGGAAVRCRSTADTNPALRSTFSLKPNSGFLRGSVSLGSKPFFAKTPKSFALQPSLSRRMFPSIQCSLANEPQVISKPSSPPKAELSHLYRVPGLPTAKREALLTKVKQVVLGIEDIETEACFNIDTNGAPLEAAELMTLRWLLSETFEPDLLQGESHFSSSDVVVEVGPRMTFTTAWSTNAVAVCRAVGLVKIRRVELSRRFKLIGPSAADAHTQNAFLALVHDRMTECPYPTTLQTFSTGAVPEAVYEVPVMQEGRGALERINREMGLAFDDWDLDYYYKLFAKQIGRNPTNVECFDMAQSNSEHSRHWFFRGRLVIDGKEVPTSLLKLVQRTLKANPDNSVIAFKDNSSVIKGYQIRSIFPQKPGSVSRYVEDDSRVYDLLFTAETHNFPSGVAPFPGAETGAGGRIRDTMATGVGSLVVAATAGYCVGNLNMRGYSVPWEDKDFLYPSNLAPPLQIIIDASNGASDYGNKFGEPLIQGYARSVGLRLPNGERREYLKPIMFSGGVGQMDHRHIDKSGPEVGMFVVKVGGPAYRIGMGGGAASSMVQGDNAAELDFNAVQRGDAEMEQKVNRVIRACVEMGAANPIVSLHDQGAGGNCNVVKEIVYPSGAKIEIRNVLVGDDTLSVLEIWGAEYQENDCLLLRPQDRALFEAMCARECVPCSFIGEIDGSGLIVVHDSQDGSTPVNLNLDQVLGDMPAKTFVDSHVDPVVRPLDIPAHLTVRAALERVLRLVAVCSKRFLTTKVDRSVTGLVAQQQCVGPLHLPVSDVAVIAQSHFVRTGVAISVGEQPLKGLVDAAAMARMSVGEAVTNLMWAATTGLNDVKCSGNWMWAAKLPGEAASILDACNACADFMEQIGLAIDGGKDSLSMAARAPRAGQSDETVKAPGTLVVSTYVSCPDVTLTVTPDLKHAGKSLLMYVDMSGGNARLGGSALAQCFGQVGDSSPDCTDAAVLVNAFNAVQHLVKHRLISAGHDRSDGGLVATLLEMAFAGNCGFNVDVQDQHESAMAAMFAEELGAVLEVLPQNRDAVLETLEKAGVACRVIGHTVADKSVSVAYNGQVVLEDSVVDLRDLWEETAFQLERLQANPRCVEEEQRGLSTRTGASYVLPFKAKPTPLEILSAPVAPIGRVPRKGEKPRVAIVREEGSNGDREMCSAFYLSGFDVWDVTMSDLKARKVSLADFNGVAFVGGFSYADVLDSAKGWAASIKFNAVLSEQFQQFYARPDTFSLGVCNGCQLMALLGWVPGNYRPHDPTFWNTPSHSPLDAGRGAAQPRFIHNSSGRFESRWSTVQIESSPAVMLRGMEGARLGVWVAHGEGRAYFPDEPSVPQDMLNSRLAPIRYVDDDGKVTERYPFNPNGSPLGIAALCSPDGRHLALMPHPERAFLRWQWPFKPQDWAAASDSSDIPVAPWIQMFQNAYKFAHKQLQ